jgi:hypothetical protein
MSRSDRKDVLADALGIGRRVQDFLRALKEEIIAL